MPASTVDEYLNLKKDWLNELIFLHQILSDLKLEETIKWGSPVYVYKGKNIVGLAAFSSYVGLWFFQGALLLDEKEKLQNAQEGKTKAMRQWRFSSMNDIDAVLVKSYVLEAMKLVDEGKEIKPAKQELIIPPLLAKTFENNPDIGFAFNAIGLSKQREFCDFINEAKQEATKVRRLEKTIEHLSRNIGLHDKYRK